MTEPTVVRSSPALWRRVGAEVLLADPDGAEVERLSVPASAAWMLLERPRTMGELTRGVAAELGLPQDEVGAHVESVVAGLQTRGWLRRADGDERAGGDPGDG